MSGTPTRSSAVSTHGGRVLIAEDDGFYRGILEERLLEAGHEVVCVSNGAEAWKELENRPFEVLLADWMMPTMDGYELCRRVKAAARLQDLYCVLLTTRDRIGDAAAALEDGADDFLVKPCTEHSLAARVRTGIRVSRLHGRLDEVARRDSLTGAGNAASLDETLFDEISRAHRYKLPLSVILVQVNDMALINGNHGHTAGDEILAGAGERVLARIRAGETAVRSNGDQFAVILPSTALEGARVVSDDLENILAQLALPRADVSPYSVSATAACAQMNASDGVSELLSRARHELSERRQEQKRERLRLMAH